MNDYVYIQRIVKHPDKEMDYSNYPFDIPVIKNFSELVFRKPVTFIIGENGSGKSTLLEAIAVALGFNAEGGSKNFNFQTYESHSDLHDYLRISRSPRYYKDNFFLRAESFYNVATEVANLGVSGSYGNTLLHNQSHGESFMSLMIHRFRGDGLYLLDEPEAALSPSRQMSMLVRMNELVEQKSQFIVATHSPIIMAYPEADIFEIQKDKLVKVQYEETEHYSITKYFLDNPELMLKELFGKSK